MQYMNTYDFDYTPNCLALLACVFNPKLSTEQALAKVAQISLRGESLTKLNKDNKVVDDFKVKLIDEQENKKYEFDSIKDCCKFLNIKTTTANTYIKYRRKFNKRYRILADGDCVDTRNKPRAVRLIDTLTNEVLDFDSMSKAGRFLKTDNKSIGKYIENKRLCKKRYKIEYKVEDGIHE